jgi:hypothetical protein
MYDYAFISGFFIDRNPIKREYLPCERYRVSVKIDAKAVKTEEALWI